MKEMYKPYETLTSISVSGSWFGIGFSVNSSIAEEKKKINRINKFI